MQCSRALNKEMKQCHLIVMAIRYCTVGSDAEFTGSVTIKCFICVHATNLVIV